MKQGTGTKISRPPIWDDAFELLKEVNSSTSVSGDDDSQELAEQLNVNKSESSEQEIAFREIIEDISPDRNAYAPDNSSDKEASLRIADFQYKPVEKEVSSAGTEVQEEPGEKDVSSISADVHKNLTEKEVSSISTGVQEKLGEKEVTLRSMGENTVLKDEVNIKSAKELYYESQKNLFETFHLIKSNSAFSIDNVFSYAVNIVSHIKVEANTWMQLLYKIDKDTNPDAVMHIVKHSLDTAVIAVRIGIGLEFSDDRLEELAMQACCHDVGMLKLPPELILKQGKLPDKERNMIKKHPEHGHEILSKYKDKYGGIADIVHKEHERYDGSGYPRGIRGGEIPENSLIIGIADMYTALLHPRPYRPRRLPFEAIKEILSMSKEQFPQHIIKALVNEFSAFPLGLYVRLNSKEVGKVITVNRLAPLSPVVEILYDANGKSLDSKTVDLMKDHCLYIAAGFYGEGD